MAGDPERIPVIVGVGQINDRPERPEEGLDPVGLMAEALRRADADAGDGWLEICDSLAVVSQIGWPELNPLDGKLAETLGIAPGQREQTAKPSGDSPILLLHEAANRIGRGESKVCAIVGGEALRTAASVGSPNRDALRDAAHRTRKGYAQSYGLVVPADVYPLYENAARAAWGQTLAEAQAETGAIWSAMSRVAEASEGAWIRSPVSAIDIVTSGPANRPIAFPYSKLQVANASVNQGAGFLVASLAEARRRGMAEDRLVFVGHGAAAHENENFLWRDRFDASPSLAASIGQALAVNALTVHDLAHVELYSCFPCIPKLARRALGWPLDRPVSVFGGLTFGGGPIGNYMSHAVAAMAEKLRGTGDTGLLFANGGYATHNHTILLSGRDLGARFPQGFDFQGVADERRGPVPPLDETYEGRASIETWTVHFDRDGTPRAGVIVARTPDGARTLALVPSEDAAMLALITQGSVEPVGKTGTIVRGEDGLARWRG